MLDRVNGSGERTVYLENEKSEGIPDTAPALQSSNASRGIMARVNARA